MKEKYLYTELRLKPNVAHRLTGYIKNVIMDRDKGFYKDNIIYSARWDFLSKNLTVIKVSYIKRKDQQKAREMTEKKILFPIAKKAIAELEITIKEVSEQMKASAEKLDRFKKAAEGGEEARKAIMEGGLKKSSFNDALGKAASYNPRK